MYDVFAKYVEGKIPILPWCELALQEETSQISSDLLGKIVLQNGFSVCWCSMVIKILSLCPHICVTFTLNDSHQ